MDTNYIRPVLVHRRLCSIVGGLARAGHIHKNYTPDVPALYLDTNKLLSDAIMGIRFDLERSLLRHSDPIHDGDCVEI